MHKSNGTVRSSIAQQQQSVTTKQKQQKTTTSIHTTGGQSSSGQTPTANKLIDKQRPKVFPKKCLMLIFLELILTMKTFRSSRITSI